jgi:hypothetical protein
MRRDSLEGEAREGDTLCMSAVTGGVPGTGSNRVQALGRGPSVDKVRAGRRLVEDARWRIGGGERASMMKGGREEEKRADGSEESGGGMARWFEY